MVRWMIILVVVVSMVGCNSREKAEKKPGSTEKAMVKQASAKLIEQGVEFLNAKDIPKAIMSFQGAIQVDPAEPQPYIILSEVFMRLKNYADAVQILERASQTFPQNGYVFYMLSLANEGNNNPLPAILAARRSVELFKAQNNEEGYNQSVLLMQTLVKSEQEKEGLRSKQLQNPDQTIQNQAKKSLPFNG